MPDDFVIEAEASWTITDTEGTQHVEIVARVKDQKGAPVTGLKKSNFSVVRPGGDGVTPVAGFSDILTVPGWESLPGTYRLSFSPFLANVRGQLIFVLRVRKTQTSGQFTLAKVGQTLMVVVKLV